MKTTTNTTCGAVDGRVTPRMIFDAIKAEGGTVCIGFLYEHFGLAQARWVEGGVSRLVSMGWIERIRTTDGYALRVCLEDK
jgi:DNA-binding transcriptional regulator PaaX